MTTRNEFVATAGKYIGYCESNGSYMKFINAYNSYKPLPLGYKMKATDEWCACFVSAIAIECGCTSIVPVECGCQRQIELFKKLGCWVENDGYVPKEGDIIYYSWKDSGSGDCTLFADHVGIVSNVSNGYMTVIEGNYSCAVGTRSIKCGARYIRGYGVPKFSESSSSSSKKSISQVVKDIIAGKYGNGAARKAKVESEGFNYQEVQNEVNATLKGNSNAKKIDALAREVIAGLHGNGSARKKSLGADYEAVQKRVNELLKK